jgi:hypothetical protein
MFLYIDRIVQTLFMLLWCLMSRDVLVAGVNERERMHEEIVMNSLKLLP